MTALAKEMVRRGMMLSQSGKTSASVRLDRHGNLRVYRLSPDIICHIDEGTSADDASGLPRPAASQEFWIERSMRDP